MINLTENINSQNQRTINYFKLFEKNPFKYHKKKNNFFLNSNENTNSNTINNNSELLFFQKENDKIVKNFHNFIKSKSQIIDKNKLNYIDFLLKEKERKSLFNNSNRLNNLKNLNYLKLSSDKINNNNYINDINHNNNNYPYSHSPKYAKNGGSDITNPNYFDNIAKKLIMKKNKEIVDYNFHIKNSIRNKNSFSFHRNLPLSPGKINNPRYYYLGESQLIRNPIVHPGNRYLSPINTFNRKKSEFRDL